VQHKFCRGLEQEKVFKKILLRANASRISREILFGNRKITRAYNVSKEVRKQLSLANDCDQDSFVKMTSGNE